MKDTLKKKQYVPDWQEVPEQNSTQELSFVLCPQFLTI